MEKAKEIRGMMRWALALLMWLGLGVWAMPAAWGQTQLGFNSSANEVLLGFDGDRLFFQRSPASGGVEALLRATETRGFEADRVGGYDAFSAERPLVLRPLQPAEWAGSGLGEVQHVSIDRMRGVLVCSARSAEGGDWDLYIAHRQTDGTWGPPHPMVALNTGQDEIFPNVVGGDIWFASNRLGGLGGYDVWLARRADQWQVVSPAPAQLNTGGDEIAAVPAGARAGAGWYLCASRLGGMGGADVFHVPGSDQGEGMASAADSAPEDTLQWVFQIVHDLQPLPNLEVRVRERGGAHVFRGVTDARGEVWLPGVTPDASHEVRVQPLREGQRLPELSFLHADVAGPSGERSRVRTYRIDGAGEVFVFDLLPLDPLGELASVKPSDGAKLPALEVALDVFFAPGSHVLDGAQGQTTRQWAQSLGPPEPWPAGWRCEVTGFADASGDRQTNERLGAERAASVAALLEAMGVPKGMIVVPSVSAKKLASSPSRNSSITTSAPAAPN